MRWCLSIAAMLAAVPVASTAEGPCAERAALVRMLDQRHGERLVAARLDGARMVELHASEDTGTWTIIVTDRRGRACLADSGHGYAGAAASVPGPGA